ncbi:MAG TPA: Gfo/Idh/MocA family oxidoreductase [Bacteroidales bacterium]|nr:Gfo/Idh/MocA family oxidoreductase [Bacteroidales bacterium]
MDQSRRDFLKKAAVGTAGITFGGLYMKPGAYASVTGANDRLNVAVVGVHSRGKAHVHALSKVENVNIAYICDVDSRVRDEAVKMVHDLTGKKPQAFTDIRKLLEEKDLDAITIATPEQWHAPMALMAMQAGKHVYVEKPCSHNPEEGEILVAAQKKYGKVVQMGNQQRSAPTSIQAVKDIREGLIGRPYQGYAWYANTRGSIGKGKKVAVPEWLDWELWQGPAPRRDYQDIWVHYNWHWFWDYGTGEINNNGTHEIDVCRWALGVDYPEKVTSAGGRYAYDDDWEFYDTQVVNYEFPDDKMITWEGRSCNGFPTHERGRGATIHGTEGTVLVDRNGYIAYNKKNEVIKELTEKEASATTDTRGEGSLDVYHVRNFVNAIRINEKQHSPIDQGAVSNLLCHLGNISQNVGRTLLTDSKNGHILNDGEAMQMWSREYEPGWEMKLS